MIIQEKIKAIAAADVALTAVISGRLHLAEVPQNPTVPYVVFLMHEDVLQIHNTPVVSTRPWKLYLYACAGNPLRANQIAVLLKNAFALYKSSAPGLTDTDIQAITIDQGISDLARTAESKVFSCSLVLDVWEQLA